MKAETIGAVHTHTHTHTHTQGNLENKKMINIRICYIYVILMCKNNIYVAYPFFISRRCIQKVNNTAIKF